MATTTPIQEQQNLKRVGEYNMASSTAESKVRVIIGWQDGGNYKVQEINAKEGTVISIGTLSELERRLIEEASGISLPPRGVYALVYEGGNLKKVIYMTDNPHIENRHITIGPIYQTEDSTRAVIKANGPAGLSGLYNITDPDKVKRNRGGLEVYLGDEIVLSGPYSCRDVKKDGELVSRLFLLKDRPEGKAVVVTMNPCDPEKYMNVLIGIYKNNKH